MGVEASQLSQRGQFTEQDFMMGTPDRIMTAGDPDILIVWPHGDETLGAHVGHHIYSERPELFQSSVDYFCGNPVAAAQDPAVRDTSKLEQPVEGFSVQGTDLNRSYRPANGPQSYEETRAAEILNLTEERGHRYVLDIHTSMSAVDRCLLVSESFFEEPQTRALIAASRICRIVVLPETVPDNENPGGTRSLVTLGLIGNLANAISVEYHRPVAQTIGVPETMSTIEGLLSDNPGFTGMPRDVYRVTHTVPKGLNFNTITNFQPHSEGFWPVLCSQENEYGNDPTKDYSGFAATSREIVRI